MMSLATGSFFPFLQLILSSYPIIANGLHITRFFSVKNESRWMNEIGELSVDGLHKNELERVVFEISEMEESWEVLIFIGSTFYHRQFIELLERKEINPKALVIYPLDEELILTLPRNASDFIISILKRLSYF